MGRNRESAIVLIFLLLSDIMLAIGTAYVPLSQIDVPRYIFALL